MMPGNSRVAWAAALRLVASTDSATENIPLMSGKPGISKGEKVG
jgi:hypothetical protein